MGRSFYFSKYAVRLNAIHQKIRILLFYCIDICKKDKENGNPNHISRLEVHLLKTQSILAEMFQIAHAELLGTYMK